MSPWERRRAEFRFHSCPSSLQPAKAVRYRIVFATVLSVCIRNMSGLREVGGIFLKVFSTVIKMRCFQWCVHIQCVDIVADFNAALSSLSLSLSLSCPLAIYRPKAVATDLPKTFSYDYSYWSHTGVRMHSIPPCHHTSIPPYHHTTMPLAERRMNRTNETVVIDHGDRMY